MVDKKKVFIVHGRNMKIRDAIFTFLRAIGLEPMEWNEVRSLTGKGDPTIHELLDTGFTQAYAILVLFTPDDVAKLKDEFLKDDDYEYERNLTSQARPNVLFEAGMAKGYKPDRTVLVEVGKLRPFSDIAGRNCIRLSNSPESRQSLVEALRTVGLDVNTYGRTDYFKAGDFDLNSVNNTSYPKSPRKLYLQQMKSKKMQEYSDFPLTMKTKRYIIVGMNYIPTRSDYIDNSAGKIKRANLSV